MTTPSETAARPKCRNCDGSGTIYRTGKSGVHGGCPCGCPECVAVANPDEVANSLLHIADDLKANAGARYDWMHASVHFCNAASRIIRNHERALSAAVERERQKTEKVREQLQSACGLLEAVGIESTTNADACRNCGYECDPENFGHEDGHSAHCDIPDVFAARAIRGSGDE